MQVEARYRRPPSAFALTPVAAPAGQVGFSFPTESGTRYTIEQAFGLVNPVWTPVDIRTGNGGVMQFTRTVSTNAAVFFRLRVD
jgi:hypothetical protein